jgi:hypothetical protein
MPRKAACCKARAVNGAASAITLRSCVRQSHRCALSWSCNPRALVLLFGLHAVTNRPLERLQ